jgi:hypothetical protein
MDAGDRTETTLLFVGFLMDSEAERQRYLNDAMHHAFVQVAYDLLDIADMYLEPDQKRMVALKAAGQFHAPDERLAPWRPWGPSDAHS